MREFVHAIQPYQDFVVGFTTLFISVALFHKKFVSPKLRKVEAMSELVTAQMTANGGGNLIDKVNRIPYIEEKVDENHRIAQEHWNLLENKIESVEKKLPIVPPSRNNNNV